MLRTVLVTMLILMGIYPLLIIVCALTRALNVKASRSYAPEYLIIGHHDRIYL